MASKLYIVSTPVGNYEDISLRALRVLGETDAILCEELRAGSRLLAHHKIQKRLVEINEHTEDELVPSLLERLRLGENFALISDHGTPLVDDPGAKLVRSALDAAITIVPVPGASAITLALVASGMPARRFRYLGLLPRKGAERQKALRSLRELEETCVVIDAPYRLMPLLKSIQEELTSERPVAVMCNLTMATERILRGAIGEVVQELALHPFKGEFVLVIGGARTRRQAQRSDRFTAKGRPRTDSFGRVPMREMN